MKRSILFSTIATMIISFIGCDTDEIFTRDRGEAGGERVLLVTINTPPSTRVALTQGENSISVTWVVDDKLELLFVQEGEIKGKKEVILAAENISPDGKRASFNVPLPDDLEGSFTLHGVYGGGGLSVDNPGMLILPTNAGNATSLGDIGTRHDMVLLFSEEVTDGSTGVTFRHLGSLFSISLKNTSTSTLGNLEEVRLVSDSGNEGWAYNSGAGGNLYDLVNEEFVASGGTDNFLSFRGAVNSIVPGEVLTYWGWYPPATVWPGLQLELIHTDGSRIALSENSKAARTQALEAGVNYTFYAEWDGTVLNFIDETINKILTNSTAGGLGALLAQNNKKHIKHLTLSGEIDYRDLLVLKQMILEENLTDLDLGNTTIVEYVDPLDDKFYPANRLPNHSFSGCNNLKSIVLPSTIEVLGNDGFSNTTGLESIVIPNSVTRLEQGVFYYSTGLKEITLSSSLEYIGPYQFAFAKITTLNLPASLTMDIIDPFIFWNMLNLTSVNVHPDNPVWSSDNGALTDNNGTRLRFLPHGLTEYTSSGTVTEINSTAFGGKTNLTKLILPGVKKLNWRSISNCPNLETIVMDDLEFISDWSIDGSSNDGLRLLDLSKAENLQFVASTPTGTVSYNPVFMTATLKEHLVIKVASEAIKNKLNPATFPNVVVDE